MECFVSRGRGGGIARDRQDRKGPAETSVLGLWTYLLPQSFPLHLLRWGLSWSGTAPWWEAGQPSEPSYFSVFRCQFPRSRRGLAMEGTGCTCAWVHTEDLGVWTTQRPRSFSVYFCPFSGIRPHASPLPQIPRSRSNPQGDRQTRGLRTRSSSPGRLDSDHAFPWASSLL